VKKDNSDLSVFTVFPLMLAELIIGVMSISRSVFIALTPKHKAKARLFLYSAFSISAISVIFFLSSAAKSAQPIFYGGSIGDSSQAYRKAIGFNLAAMATMLVALGIMSAIDKMEEFDSL
jgi:hypothetical protein